MSGEWKHNFACLCDECRGTVSEPAADPVLPSPMGKYELLGAELGQLTDQKNAAYGASFQRAGEVLAILYPIGIAPSQYRDALAVVRLVDKLFRIATNRDAFGEDPWRDIVGYALLGAGKDE